jgi:hypothetical protein
MDWLPVQISENLMMEAAAYKRSHNSAAVKNLYRSKEYCDVVLKLREKEYPAYRSALYEASPYFRDMLTRMKQNHGYGGTSSSQRITLPTWFVDNAFEVVISFLFGCLSDIDQIEHDVAIQVLKQAEFLGLD